jgi:hypothetical protein
VTGPTEQGLSACAWHVTVAGGLRPSKSWCVPFTRPEKLTLRAPALHFAVHGKLGHSVQRAGPSWTGSGAQCTYVSEEQSKVFKCGLKICTGTQHY